MTVLVVLLGLALLGFLLYRAAAERSPSRTIQTPAPLRPPPALARPPRFAGRRVTVSLDTPVSPPTAPRLRAARHSGSLANGKRVLDDNAIGLACLRPISECTLGERCVCLGQQQRRGGGGL